MSVRHIISCVSVYTLTSHNVRDKIKVPYQRSSNVNDRVNIVTGFYRQISPIWFVIISGLPQWRLLDLDSKLHMTVDSYQIVMKTCNTAFINIHLGVIQLMLLHTACRN